MLPSISLPYMHTTNSADTRANERARPNNPFDVAVGRFTLRLPNACCGRCHEGGRARVFEFECIRHFSRCFHVAEFCRLIFASHARNAVASVSIMMANVYTPWRVSIHSFHAGLTFDDIISADAPKFENIEVRMHHHA